MNTTQPTHRVRLNLLLVAALLVFAGSAGAAVIYKDAATTDMNTVANWSTVYNAATPDPSSIGASDELRFNEMFAPTSGTTYTANLSNPLTVGCIRSDYGSGSGGTAFGNVSITGTATLTLMGTGDGSYNTSGFVLNSATGGTLTIAPPITLGANQVITASRALTINGNVNIGNYTWTPRAYGNGKPITINGNISGTGGSLSVNTGGGSYAVNLAGNNSYTGVTTISAGTLTISGNYTGGGDYSLNGGSLTVTGTGSVTAGAVANTSTSSSLTINSGGVMNCSSYTLNYAPSTFQVDGTLNISGALTPSWNATKSLTGAGTINAGSFANNNYSVTTIAVNRLNLGGNITFGTAGATALTLSGTTLGAYANWSSSVAMTLSGTDNFNTLDSVDGVTARTITLSGALSGTGALTKTGTGTLTLSGASTYTGTTTVSGGKLLVNGSIATSTSTTVSSGATLGGSGTAGAVTVNSGGTFTAGDATGSGSLAVSTLTFGAAGGDTQTVNVKVGSSTSIINASGALTANGTTTINVTGAGLTVGNTYHLISYKGTALSSGFTLGTLPSRVQGTLQYNTDSGTNYVDLVVSVVDYPKWNGLTDANWDTTTANWTLNTAGGSVTYVDGIPGDQVLFDDTLTAHPAVTLNNTITPALVTVSNTTTAYIISGGGSLSGSMTLVKQGTGTLTLSTANAYTGGTTVNGGTLKLGAANSLPTAGATTVSSGAVLDLNGQPVGAEPLTLNGAGINNGGALINSSGTAASLSGTVSLATATSIGGSGNTTLSGIISGSSIALTKVGTGTLTLSGVNTYSGGTVITGGTVKLGNAQGVGLSGSYGGTLTVKNGTFDVNGMSNYHNSNQSGSPYIWLTTATVTLGGVAGGTPQIVDSGATPLGIAFANSTTALTYDATGNPGIAIISARWGQIGSSNPGTRVVNVGDSTATSVELDFTGGLGDVNAWDGRSATIQKTGAGTMRISSANNFPGLQVTAGTLLVNHSQALGADRTASSGAVNLLTVDGGTVDLNGFNPSIGGLNSVTNGVLATTGVIMNNGATTATLTVGASGASTTNGATIQDGTGKVNLTKTNAGTLTLSGANTYTGNTTISGGTLALGGSGSVASANVSVSVGAKFDVSALSSYTLNSGTLTLNVNKSGGTDTQGQVVIGSKNLTYAGSLTVVSNANSAAFAAGDIFALVSTNTGATFSGWFSSVTLPTLASGLAWDTNNLAASGTLDVYSFSVDALSFAATVGHAATIPASKLASRLHSSKNSSIYPSTWKASVPGTTTHGSASIDVGGNLVYIPVSAGSDAFNVTFYDGHGWQTMSVTATVAAASVGPSLSGADNGHGYYRITTSGAENATYNVQARTLDNDVWSDWATMATGMTADQYGVITWTDTEAISAHQGKEYRLAQ